MVVYRRALFVLLLALAGCEAIVRQTDRDVERLIAVRQREAIDQRADARVRSAVPLPKGGRQTRRSVPSPTSPEIPAEFNQAAAATQPASAPASPTAPGATSAYRSAPQPVAPAATRPVERFTLTRALAYAQEHRRAFATAKEDLYLSALALTLERHLWTPIFAANFRTVYGNYGERRNFDQAMRFVADLAVSQRLPYGGEITAQMVSTLIRDVSRTITAAEGSNLGVGVNIPLLRGAGHVARETLIQLERELTYSVRSFERFRRQQLVTVANAYFDLLRIKQRVEDSEDSLRRAVTDYERAKALEIIGRGSVLDTQRAEQRMLSAENDVEQAREDFRLEADGFKIEIGMPVDAPLERDDLEDILAIEHQIEAGVYPLLQRPVAVELEALAIEVALARRLDLLTAQNRVEDARRGVQISKNALLPDLNFTTDLSLDTDPNHYNIGAFNWDRANWRSEVVLEIPLERTRERVELRRSIIEVHQAQRAEVDLAERIRAEVRRAVNQLRLQDTTLRIQERSVEVTQRQAEYAALRFQKGEIDNRDKIEAERALLDAQNALNQAKTNRWAAVLGFRLATETLIIDDDGVQLPDPDLPGGEIPAPANLEIVN